MARITYKGGTVNTVIPKITKDYRRSENQGISITPNQVHNLISSLSTLEIKKNLKHWCLRTSRGSSKRSPTIITRTFTSTSVMDHMATSVQQWDWGIQSYNHSVLVQFQPHLASGSQVTTISTDPRWHDSERVFAGFTQQKALQHHSVIIKYAATYSSRIVLIPNMPSCSTFSSGEILLYML